MLYIPHSVHYWAERGKEEVVKIERVNKTFSSKRVRDLIKNMCIVCNVYYYYYHMLDVLYIPRPVHYRGASSEGKERAVKVERVNQTFSSKRE